MNIENAYLRIGTDTFVIFVSNISGDNLDASGKPGH